MSYEPSHRKPPRQERWPNATPGEGWPAYQQGEVSRAWEPAAWEPAAAFAGSRNSYGDAGGEPWTARNGYGTTTGYPAAGDGYADGFDGAPDRYPGTGTENYYETGNAGGYDGWDGYTQPGHEFPGPAGYPAQDEYPALDSASSVLAAPDTMGEWWRQPDRGRDGDDDRGERGLIVGAVTGLLAAAVAIGVATFAAAFVRPQTSPVSAVAGVLVDHLPTSLKSPVAAHFGAHGRTVLLLGAIGLTAMVFGCLARHNPSVGVAGLAAFGLLGAFVAITRPESRASAVIPWAIGGAAGILALMWLARASAPASRATSPRPAYGGSARGGGRRAR